VQYFYIVILVDTHQVKLRGTESMTQQQNQESF
jgi:hypothetical protein